MSFCSVAAYSFTGIMTSPKEIEPFHMLCMMSPYPARAGTDTAVLSGFFCSAICSMTRAGKERAPYERQ